MNQNFLLFLLVSIISIFHCVPRVLGTPIIGSFMDQRHSYKYQVSLHKINLRTSTYEHFCGGTIIHEKYVLTAAHCFIVKEHGIVTRSINLVQERLKIIAETNKRIRPGIERDVVTIFIPNTYQTMPNQHGDIAIVQLRDNLGVARNRRTLEIMSLGQLPHNEANKRATFCGFGYHQLESESAGRLHILKAVSELNRFFTVILLGERECPDFHSKICSLASDKSEIRIGCYDGSGAGLIFEDRIVVVFSCGPRNCDSNTVSMAFTRLSLFTNQIDRATNERVDHSDIHVLREHSIAYMSPDTNVSPQINANVPISPHNMATSHKLKKRDISPDNNAASAEPKKRRSGFSKFLNEIRKEFKDVGKNNPISAMIKMFKSK